MSLSLFLLIVSIAIVVLVGFLVFTLIRFNRLLEKSTLILETVREKLPAMITDLQNTSANMSAISDTLAQGVGQAAAGVESLRSFSMESVIALFRVVIKGINFLRGLLKRRATV